MTIYCKTGQKPTIIYNFKDGKERIYKSKVSPIEVVATKAPVGGTDNYNPDGYRISFDIPFNPSVSLVVRDYTLFKVSEPNNPSIIYDAIKFIDCDAPGFNLEDGIGIGVVPESIVIDENIKCPTSAKDRCNIQIKHEGKIIFVDQGLCPITFKVRCGNCDEGFIECPHPGYPGYCCIDCKGTAAKKQSNDALYEVREGRKKLEIKINEQDSNFKSLKAEFDKAFKNIGSGFQEKIAKTITEIQSSLKSTDNQIKSANEKISVQGKIISELQAGFKSVQGLPKTLDTKIAELKEFTIKLVNGKLQPVEVEQRKINQQVATIQKSGVTRSEIETTNASLRRTYEQSFEYKAQQWQQEIQRQNETFWNKKTEVTLSSNTKVTQSNTEKISQLEKDNTKIKTDLDRIGKQIKEQEKVNQEAIPKLNSILNLIPLIPARVADNLKPSIPTIPQIETATGKAMCNSLKTGCGKKAIDDAVNNVNGNTNQNTGNILDAINTGANAAQLEILNTINNKLGVQLPGGLSGTFGRLLEMLQVDRIINILTLITTMHNAAMLSRSIGETLFSAFDNIAQLVGFKWKNEKGEEVGFGALVSEWTENFFKTIFGEDNYNNAKKSWNAANRMYQATTNMFYQVQGMFDSARSIAELTANNTGKIGNALKKGGAIFENAFPNMSENTTSKTAYQKKWDNIVNGLNNVEETASAFSSITGEMVSIGEKFNELKNQRDEFLKSKDDAEKAVTTLINGEKDAAKVNQEVNKTHTQKSED